MFKNHFKMAWRNLKRQAFFAFLNTFGLAIGITGGLLISLYIYDELSYDKMFADADRIYRIDTDIKFGGAEIKATEVAAPMAAAITNDIPIVENTVRFRDRGSMLLRKSDTNTNTKEQHATFADASFFEMFGIDLLVGDVHSALSQPNTLVLTKSAAEKHFGITNAVGQNLILNNSETYIVSGVIDDLPGNSFLRDHTVFMAMAGYADSHESNWGSTNYFTLVKLIPGATIEEFQGPLQQMFEKYMIPWAQEVFPGMSKDSFEASGNFIRYHTMALTDIHLYSNRQFEMSANSSMQNVYILSFIGLFLLVLASVNFMNLATAQSLKRTKEVGIRKTLGSNRRELIRQFLVESGLLTFISLLLALLLAMIVLPFFNELSGKTVRIPFANPHFWGLILLATLVLGLFSGSYPAFFMSRFMPVRTLSGSAITSAGGGKVRNALVVFQFAISVFLIVATLVVYQQMNYILGKDLGFAKEQVVFINDTYAAGDQAETFKAEVIKLSQVQNATLSDNFPTPSSRSSGAFFKEGAMDQEHAIQLQNWDIDADYIPTMDMQLIAGRNFNRAFGTDSTAVIINEATLAVLGLRPEEAIGIRISQDFELEEQELFTVIGVVRNFHYESLRENIGALGLFMDRSFGTLAVKLKAGDFTEALMQIESVWNTIAPGQPFSYEFMDDAFNTTYKAEQRLGKIFIVFTFLSILIACLGLFGLAAFNAQKRTKEIGIRKVLGASISEITFQLTTDFLRMVVIAILISLPVGWFTMNKWLEDFSYRIEIGWWVYILAALLALGIAIATVSYQSIKAAIVNPVKSLRTE